MRWVLASLRRLRSDRAMVVALGLLVLATGAVFGISPRLLAATADNALREEIAAAVPRDRSIQVIEETRIPPASGSDPIEAEGERQLARMPASIQALVSDHSYTAESPRWNVDDPGLLRSTFVLRTQQSIEDHVKLVAGRWPTDATTTRTGRVVGTESPETITVFEAALSEETAQFLRVDVGKVIELRSDSSDRLAVFHSSRVGIQVVGIFRVDDGTEPFWLGDDTLARPALRIVSPENAYYDAVALLSRDGFDALQNDTAPSQLPMRYTWRWFTDPSRLNAAGLDQLIVDTRRLDTLFPSRVNIGGPSEPILQTSLLRLLEAQRDRWTASSAVIVVVALGPVVVALAALALVTLLATRRARAAVALWSSRGASALQLIVAGVIESVVPVVPAAILAALAATSLAREGDDLVTAAGVIVVALLPVVVFVAAFVAGGRRGGAPIDRAAGTIRRTSPRRLWLEALLVVMAVAGIVLLRSRTGSVGSTGGQPAGADPFITAVPVLAGLAGGLVVARLVPVLLAPLAALAGRRRDVVPFIASRRVTRGANGGPVLLVLLATATLASFSAALLAHIDEAANTVAWHDVGAAFELDAGSHQLPDGMDPATLPGVEAAALGHRVDVPLGVQGARVSVLALDVADYLQVTKGTPVEPQIPGQLLVGAPATGPLPAIISRSLTSGASAVQTGQTFQLSIGGRNRMFQAVAVADTFPTMPAGSRFAILSRAQLEAVAPDWSFAPDVAFLRAPDSAAAELRAAAARDAPGIPLSGRAEVAASLREAPSTAAVTASVGIAVLLTAAFAALAVAVSLALAGAARSVETTHLRALGLRRRQVFGLAALEHGPTLLVALLLGLVLGPALFLVLQPGLGLDSLVRSTLPVPLSLDVVSLVAGLGGVALLTVVGIGLAAVAQGRAGIAATLRRNAE